MKLLHLKLTWHRFSLLLISLNSRRSRKFISVLLTVSSLLKTVVIFKFWIFQIIWDNHFNTYIYYPSWYFDRYTTIIVILKVYVLPILRWLKYIDRNIIMDNKYALKCFARIVLNIQNLNIKTLFRKRERVNKKSYKFTTSSWVQWNWRHIYFVKMYATF